MVEMQYKLDPSLMLSYSAIKCTHHRLDQLSPTMTMMIGDNENRENCDDHINMIGVMLMISTAKSPSPGTTSTFQIALGLSSFEGQLF